MSNTPTENLKWTAIETYDQIEGGKKYLAIIFGKSIRR